MPEKKKKCQIKYLQKTMMLNFKPIIKLFVGIYDVDLKLFDIREGGYCGYDCKLRLHQHE